MICLDKRGCPCPIPVVEAKKALESAEAGTWVEVLVDNAVAVQNLRKLAAHKGLAAEDEKRGEGEYAVRIQSAGPAAQTAGPAAQTADSAAQTADSAARTADSAARTADPAARTAEVNDGHGADGGGLPDDLALESCQLPGSGETATENPEEPAEPASSAVSGSPAELASPVEKGMVLVIGSDQMGQGDEKLGHMLMKSFMYAAAKQDRLPETILLFNGGARLSCEGSESLEDLREMEKAGCRILTCGTCLDFYGLKETLAVGEITNMYEIVETMTAARKLVHP